MTVFLEFRKPAEADLIERQDQTGCLQLLPGSDQAFLSDLGLTIDDFFRPSRKADKPPLDGAKRRHRAQTRNHRIAQLPPERWAPGGNGLPGRLKFVRGLTRHTINSVGCDIFR